MSGPFSPPPEVVRPPPELTPPEERLLGYAQATAGPKLVAAGALAILGLLPFVTGGLRLYAGTFDGAQVVRLLLNVLQLLAAALCAWSGIRGFLAGARRPEAAGGTLEAELWFWRLVASTMLVTALAMGLLFLVALQVP